MWDERAGIFPWEIDTVETVIRNQRPWVRLLQSGLYLDVDTGEVIGFEEGPREEIQ